MKKIFLCACLGVAINFAFAQQTPSNSQTPSSNQQVPNSVTNQFQNQNTPGYYMQGRKMMQDSIPGSVSGVFSGKYPEQKNVTWYTQKDGYMATYQGNDKMQQSVIYDKNGKVVSNGMQVQSTRLPQSARDYMKKTYPDQTASNVYMITSPTGTTYYEVESNGKWMHFDEKGNYIPEK